MESGVCQRWEVPEAWRKAADEVRDHLCALRGGGLFLSSADTLLLTQWLEQGRAVVDVLKALERAAEARTKARSRIPLSLTHARRHLGRPTRGAFATVVVDTREPVFAPAARVLRALPNQTPVVLALQQRLLSISDTGEEAVRVALQAVRTYLADSWDRLGPSGQATLRDQARRDLGDLVHLVDEPTVEALVEEGARAHLRAPVACLSVASLTELANRDA